MYTTRMNETESLQNGLPDMLQSLDESPLFISRPGTERKIRHKRRPKVGHAPQSHLKTLLFLKVVVVLLVLHAPSSEALFASPSSSEATNILSTPRQSSLQRRPQTFQTVHSIQRTCQASPPGSSSTTSLKSESGGNSHDQSTSDESIIPGGHQTQSTTTSNRSINKRAMTWTLSLAYFTVMGAKCALPSVLALLTSHPSAGGLIFPAHSSPSQAMAQLLTLSTLAIAAGKLVLGPVIDTFTGGVFLQVTLLILSTLLGFLAVGPRHFGGFFVAWMGIDFIFSSCWASCINAIHQYFDPTEWAALISHLATGARAGNAMAFLAFSAVLTASTNYFPKLIQQVPSLPWRMVFALSALAQLIPLGMLMRFATPTQKRLPKSAVSNSATTQQPKQQSSSRSSRTRLRQSLQLAWKQAHRLDFWMHFVSRSVLMVFASFLLFVPTCMVHVFGATASFASQTGSAYALGCLLAVTGLSKLYNRIVQKSKWHKLMTVSSLTGLAATSSGLFWAHCANLVTLSPLAACALFFTWGFAMAIPFYSKSYLCFFLAVL